MMAADSGSRTSERRTYRVRKADGREDAFYLVRQWQHYFGAEYEYDRLPWPLFDTMGWENDEIPMLKSYGVIAEHGNVAVGGGLVSLLDHDEATDELPKGRFDAGALAGDRNAFLWLGVVDSAWRGHGIGRALFRNRLQWATAHGADMIFAYGWERRAGRTSRPLFEGHDFVPIQHFGGYYESEESARTSCPDCSSWPSNDRACHCDMTLWAADGGEVRVQ